MIPLRTFLASVQEIVASKPTYELGRDGSRGSCDCIGLIIGAVRRSGGTWTGSHGSNWTARNRMITLRSPAPLELGGLVFKAHEPGTAANQLPGTYKGHPDQRDYYHVGVITSVKPLRITHCTGGTINGIKVDTAIGAWRFGGRLLGVEYEGKEAEEVSEVVNETAETMLETALVRAQGGKTVRMRARPGTDAIAVAYVPLGATVDVLEKAAEWWRIRYEGKTGWMQAAFLDGTHAPGGGGAGSPVSGEYVMVPIGEIRAIITRLQGMVAK